jgi:polysaccharide biosynthesis protein PslG
VNKPKTVVSIIFLIILVITSFVLIYSRISQTKTLATYHGPNPNVQLVIETEPGSVLSKRSRSNTQYNTTVKSTSIPTSTPTPIPTATPVPSKTEQYGIAVGSFNGLSQADLNKYFTNLKALGITFVRWDIDWGTVQHSSRTSYDWSSIDRVVDTAKQFGINNLGIIDYSPKWAAGPSCDVECTPTDTKAFGAFAWQVAARYKGRIDYFEIWNEPNTSLKITPYTNTYAELLKEAYTQIKLANPNATVISGGLAASADESAGNTSPITFVKTLYTLGANKYFDALALHPYSFPATPNYVASWNSWQQMAQIRQIMINNGDTSKKIWITEYGAPTNGPGSAFNFNQLDGFNYGSDFMTESTQTEFINEISTYYNKNYSWMGPVFWYSLQDRGTGTDTPENFFGLLKFDGSQKSAYSVMKNIISTTK